MSNESNRPSEIFEISRLRKLIELLREYDLNEIDLQDDEQRIHIKRGGATPMAVAAPTYTVPPAMPGPAPNPASGAAPAEETGGTFIKSPMVGTFYSRPKPDQPSFVKVGDVVSPETIVCIVEAMKMFNEIPAGVAGRVVEICVKDGEAVDVNKPLFRLAG